jgi:hypothetical protein
MDEQYFHNGGVDDTHTRYLKDFCNTSSKLGASARRNGVSNPELQHQGISMCVANVLLMCC